MLVAGGASLLLRMWWLASVLCCESHGGGGGGASVSEEQAARELWGQLRHRQRGFAGSVGTVQQRRGDIDRKRCRRSNEFRCR